MNRILIVACLLFTGCATAYQSGKYSVTGGYIDQPVTERLLKVTFSANGYTDVNTAVTYAKFRCAELAQEKNKPYFMLYPSLNSAAMDRPSSHPNVGSLGAKPAAFAYVMFVDEERPGANKTSVVLVELEAYRLKAKQEAEERQRRQSAKKPKKKKSTT